MVWPTLGSRTAKEQNRTQQKNVEIAHVTLTTPTLGTLTHHKTKTRTL